MFGISKALLAAAGGLLLAGFASPAGPIAAARQLGPAQQPTSVTGCLEKGTAKDTYTLKDAAGKTYTLSSATVKFSEHVGHKVTVTGTAAGMETGALKDTGAAAAPPAKMGKSTTPGSTLTVTTIKHVASSCK
jgi:hypothetical protein